MEQQSQQSTAELDKLNKKTEQTIENEGKHATEMGYTREADAGVRHMIDYLLNFLLLFFRNLYYKWHEHSMKCKTFRRKSNKLNYVYPPISK